MNNHWKTTRNDDLYKSMLKFTSGNHEAKIKEVVFLKINSCKEVCNVYLALRNFSYYNALKDLINNDQMFSGNIRYENRSNIIVLNLVDYNSLSRFITLANALIKLIRVFDSYIEEIIPYINQEKPFLKLPNDPVLEKNYISKTSLTYR